MTSSSTQNMDQIFKSLADATRRDILRRLIETQLSVTEIAEPYDLGYATISKHLKVLEKANLIHRRREGKSFMIWTNPDPLQQVDDWMQFFRSHWNDSLDKLDDYLKNHINSQENSR